uniref:PHLPP-like RA domain-containing protein n=1 Tax=Megaselia scalaris TaxID=36166 RepID=T1GPS7_MEGSC
MGVIDQNDFLSQLQYNKNINQIYGSKSSFHEEKDIGWIRVFCGPDRSDLLTIEPSRMVRCSVHTTTKDIVKCLNLPKEYTLWVQFGCSEFKRFQNHEYPYKLQNEFYINFGYTHISRRMRLEIDPEMKYLLRFFIGPSDISECPGVLKSGKVDILKGLVYPQWQYRSLAIIGSVLYICPLNSYMAPEVFDISEAEVLEHSPKYDRLILKLVTKFPYEKNNNNSYKSKITTKVQTILWTIIQIKLCFWALKNHGREICGTSG